MKYFKYSEINVSENHQIITDQYNKGYVFTRIKKNHMVETISLRINLEKFYLFSKNHRVLKKNEDLKVELKELPLPNYNWKIHKLGSYFYKTKFGDMIMSASKIKEMFSNSQKSNMNCVFEFKINNTIFGYALCYQNNYMIHYAYPFYDLNVPKEKLSGIAMILKAIILAKEQKKKYFYLGSVNSKASLYKLQFKALEWWDFSTKTWETNLEKLKLLVETLNISETV